MLLWRAAHRTLGADAVAIGLNQLGYLALVCLMASLACTPLKIVTGWTWPVRVRRMLGLFAVFYASLHLPTYVGIDQQLDWAVLWGDVTQRKFMIVGFTAFFCWSRSPGPAPTRRSAGWGSSGGRRCTGSRTSPACSRWCTSSGGSAQEPQDVVDDPGCNGFGPDDFFRESRPARGLGRRVRSAASGSLTAGTTPLGLATLLPNPGDAPDDARDRHQLALLQRLVEARGGATCA